MKRTHEEFMETIEERLSNNWTNGADVRHLLERHAELLRENAELRANNARLREAYAPFVEMWRDAYDPDDMTDVDLGNKLYWLDRIIAESPAASLEAVRAEEREACAKIAHHYWVRWDHPTNMKCAETIEKAIRARGDGGEQAG